MPKSQRHNLYGKGTQDKGKILRKSWPRQVELNSVCRVGMKSIISKWMGEHEQEPGGRSAQIVEMGRSECRESRARMHREVRRNTG